MQSSAKVLIVDDERIALRNLEHVMKKEGYEVTGTQSGANAMTCSKSGVSTSSSRTSEWKRSTACRY